VRFDYEDGRGSSGFHLGRGWIVTNSHCVSAGGKYDEGKFVCMVKDAKITLDGKTVVATKSNCGMIVFARIKAGNADFDKSDLALLYIPEFAPLPAVSVVNEAAGYVPAAINVASGDIRLLSGEQTATLHYGWNPDRPDSVLESAHESISEFVKEVAFRRTKATTTGGSSGSPVFSGDYQKLVGVHFASGGSAVRITSLLKFMQDTTALHAHFSRAEVCRALPNGCGANMAAIEERAAASLLAKANYGVHYLS
jgi:hypothetical protein